MIAALVRDVDGLLPLGRVHDRRCRSGDGQMSGLISFIIQGWWPAPSVEPASTVYWTHSAGLSRQYIQPGTTPAGT